MLVIEFAFGIGIEVDWTVFTRTTCNVISYRISRLGNPPSTFRHVLHPFSYARVVEKESYVPNGILEEKVAAVEGGSSRLVVAIVQI